MSKNFWHDIESGADIPEIINVVELKGSMNKYEYDKNNMINYEFYFHHFTIQEIMD